jgi:serine/threonine protein kinase
MSSSASGADPLGQLADDFLERWRRGERPALTEYTDRHPELAGQIRELFPALVMMEEVRPGPPTVVGAAAAPAAAAPWDLGEYRVVRELGRGGMGVVYEAEQLSLGRRVALKVLPSGALGDAHHVERFQREARAAARLHHTNIVPVFAVGEEGGTHYYVMQYIEGQPLDQVLAELRRLRAEAERGAAAAELAFSVGPPSPGLLSSADGPGSPGHGRSRPAAAGPDSGPAGPDPTDVEKTVIRPRGPVAGGPAGAGAGEAGSSSLLAEAHRPFARRVAQIGAQVAEALDYAAGQGVLHRDIKPSNLLLDIWGTVWLTDFGLAKATGTPDLTRSGDLLGTLRYLAPERFEGQADVRSDVYSLGLTLYELLALRPAYSGHSQAELFRHISAADAPRLERLNPQLPRDLVTIVHKAMAKEPADRYQTARALAEDLRRFLDDRSIVARRVGLLEQAWRWCRRNPSSAALLAAISVVLVAGAAISTWQAVRATRAEAVARRAEQAETERAEGERLAKLEAQEQKADAEQAAAAERAAAEQAQKRLRQIEKTNDILGSIFDSLDPNEIARAGRPLQAILVEKLDRAVQQLEGESIGDPLVVAKMQVRFGLSLISLGEPGKAIGLLEKALATQQAQLGPDHPDTLISRNTLAAAYQAAGKRDLALPLLEGTLKLRQAKLGPEHPHTLHSMNNLAVAYLEAGKRDLALPLFEETLKLMKAKVGPEHPETLRSMNNLAWAYQKSGKLDLALALYEETLKLRKAKLGPEHPETLQSMNNLAWAYKAARQLDKALPLFEETLKLQKARLGPEHPQTLTTMGNLATAYQAAGKLDLALPLFEETLKLQKARLSPDDASTLHTMGNLAVAYQAAGKLDLALPLFEETLKLMKANLGPDHPDTLASRNNLAMAYQAAGKRDLALPLLEETLKLQKAKLGPEHPQTRTTMKHLALLRNIGTAEERYRGNLARLGPDHIDTLLARRDVAQLYLATNRLDEAETILVEVLDRMKTRANDDAIRLFTIGLLRKCLTTRERTMPDSWLTFRSQCLLGGALLGLQNYAAAEPLLRAGYEGMKRQEARIPPDAKVCLTEAVERLVQLYEATDRKDEAAKWRKERQALRPAPKGPETRP